MRQPKLRTSLSISPLHRALLRKLAQRDCVHPNGTPNLSGWMAQTIEVVSEDRGVRVTDEEVAAEWPPRARRKAG